MPKQPPKKPGPNNGNDPTPSGGTGGGKGDNRRQARERARIEAERMQRKRRTTQILIFAVVAVVAVGIVLSAVLLGRSDRNAQAPSANTNVNVAGASVPLKVDGSAVQVGKDDAKVTLDLWVDYSCPHCQEFEAESNEVISQKVASGELKARYHNIQIVTAYGTQAGSAAACVATHAPDQWPAFNAALYANHNTETDSWQGAQLADFAAQQGITNAEAQSCIKAESYKSWIADNTAAAGQAGVTGTPTLFFNGEKAETVSGAALGAKIDQLAGQ